MEKDNETPKINIQETFQIDSKCVDESSSKKNNPNSKNILDEYFLDNLLLYLFCNNIG